MKWPLKWPLSAKPTSKQVQRLHSSSFYRAKRQQITLKHTQRYPPPLGTSAGFWLGGPPSKLCTRASRNLATPLFEMQSVRYRLLSRSVGTAGALTPAMLKPRGREHLFAPAIFSHIFACCSSNFHSLSLCCLHTIRTSHSHSVGTTGRIHAF